MNYYFYKLQFTSRWINIFLGNGISKQIQGVPKNFFPYIIHLRQIIFIFVGNDMHRNKQYYLAKTDKYYFAEFVETCFSYLKNTILAVLEQNVQQKVHIGKRKSTPWIHYLLREKFLYNGRISQIIIGPSTKFPFLPNYFV